VSQSRNQTITTNPDAATQRYAEQVRGNALGVFNTLTGLTGQTQGVAPLSPEERRAMELAQGFANRAPTQWQEMQGIINQSDAQGRGIMAALAGQFGVGLDPLRTVAGQTGDAMGLLAQQAQLGGGLTADMAARYGQGADVLSGAAGMTGGAQSAQQMAAMGLLAPGLAAQQAALAGGPDVSAFMNPFQSQVIDATRASFDSARNRLNRNLSDRATQAGAFGGSREAVARGQALADLARDETQQISGLLNSGFSDAMARAMADQQFRFGAGSQMSGAGLGVLDTLAARGLGAGSQLVGGGMAAQQQGANALGQLFGGGQNAAQFLTGQAGQNANALANLGFSAQNTLFNNAMGNLGLLGQLGGVTRGIEQARLDSPLNRQLQALNALGIGFNGAGQVQVIPQTRNQAAGALGGAAQGAAIGGQFGGPWGAAIGGLLGGGLGAFGG
jgi:hypothetical protein